MNLDSGVNEQLAKSGGFGIDPLESNYFSFFAVVLVVLPLVMWLAVSVPFLLLAIPFAPIAIAIVLLCVLTVYTSKIVSLYGLDRLGKAKHRQDRAEEVGTAEGPGEADDSKTGDGGEEDDDGGLKGLADVEIELEMSAETGWGSGVKGKARKMRRFSEMSLRDKLRVQPGVYSADPSDEVALRLKIFAVLSLAGINVMLAFNALYDGGNWVAVFRNALDSIRFSLRVDFAIGWAWPESLKWPELSALAQVQFAVSVGLFCDQAGVGSLCRLVSSAQVGQMGLEARSQFLDHDERRLVLRSRPCVLAQRYFTKPSSSATQPRSNSRREAGKTDFTMQRKDIVSLGPIVPYIEHMKPREVNLSNCNLGGDAFPAFIRAQ